MKTEQDVHEVEPRGITRAFSPARRMVAEMMHHSQRLPLLPCARTMQLAPLVQARRCSQRPPSWTAMFLKGFGLTGQQHSELRQLMVEWPWSYLYEHPYSNAAIPIEREVNGQKEVLMAKIMRTELCSLEEIDLELRRLQTEPVEKVNYFRQWLLLGKLPWLLRRFAFWQTLYFSGYKKAKRFGTFTVTSVGNLDAEIEHAWTPLTTYATFGKVAANGECTVRMVFDHRVMDARTVARCLATWEEIMNHAILAELKNPTQAAA